MSANVQSIKILRHQKQITMCAMCQKANDLIFHCSQSSSQGLWLKGRKFYPEIHKFHMPTSQLPIKGGGSGGWVEKGVMASPDFSGIEKKSKNINTDT